MSNTSNKQPSGSSGVNGAIPRNPNATKINTAIGEANISASDIRLDIISIVHDIIKIVEKDSQDVTQKNKDSLESSQKILELGKRFEQVRSQIYKLPGIEGSKDEQLRQLDILFKQHECKVKLIQKYKQLNLKLSSTPPTEEETTNFTTECPEMQVDDDKSSLSFTNNMDLSI